VSVPTQEVHLRVENLRKQYGSHEALRGIEFEVRRGEIYGVIGPDGAGKTTLMRLLCGLLASDDGSISLDGFDPIVQPQEVRERIGYMPQRFSLYPDLSVSENLAFFAELFLVSREEFRRREPELMAFSRLAPFRPRRAGALSGGMKQKLALICTLIHTPEILILDEPTFGVDPVSRKEFWDILGELARDGMTIVVSTAYMDEAGLCDRLALLHHGQIIEQGTPEEVINSFGHRLLEVRGGEIREIRKTLEALSLPGVEVHRFGDRLHVVYDTTRQEGAIRSALGNLEAEVREVRPGIEDAFVSLLRTGSHAA